MRRRVEGGVDYATMTWRLGEDAQGRVSLELLSARLGPGAYDPDDDTTTAGHRTTFSRFNFTRCQRLCNSM